MQFGQRLALGEFALRAPAFFRLALGSGAFFSAGFVREVVRVWVADRTGASLGDAKLAASLVRPKKPRLRSAGVYGKPKLDRTPHTVYGYNNSFQATRRRVAVAPCTGRLNSIVSPLSVSAEA